MPAYRCHQPRACRPTQKGSRRPSAPVYPLGSPVCTATVSIFTRVFNGQLAHIVWAPRHPSWQFQVPKWHRQMHKSASGGAKSASGGTQNASGGAQMAVLAAQVAVLSAQGRCPRGGKYVGAAPINPGWIRRQWTPRRSTKRDLRTHSSGSPDHPGAYPRSETVRRIIIYC